MPASTWGADRLAAIEAGLARSISGANAMLENVDLLLTPVTHVVDFPAESIGLDEAMPLRHATFTAPFNQSGRPVATIGGGFDPRGLPIGIQLVGHRFDDLRLLRLAVRLEEVLRRDMPRPPR